VEFITYIAKTNLFNFVIFLGIIIFICLKINVKQKLEDAKQNVVDTVEHSTAEKETSEQKLSEVQESLSNIGVEIDEILEKSLGNAKLVGEKIIEEAHNSVAVIQDNTQKAITNSQNILRNELIKRAATASIEVAKAHIIKELETNTDLHEKFINESIEQVEGVNP